MEQKIKEILNKHGVPVTEPLVSDLKAIFDDSGSLEERKKKFIESLRPHLEDMGRDEANNFYHYWAALKPRSKYMAWEKEKSWDLESRIRTWMKNKEKFKIVNMLKKK